MLRGAERGAAGPSWWIPCLGLVGLTALWARLSNWAEVFVDGRALPRLPDTYYHLRQTLRSIETFPAVPHADPQLNWPDGGFSVWAPGFDWLGAALALLLGFGDDPDGAARVAMFLPPLFGIATLWVVIVLTRSLARDAPSGASIALTAGLIWALLPNAVIVSRLGRLDHHVGEVLAMAILGGWALWRADAADDDLPRHKRVAFELSGAGIATGAGLIFSGSVLYAAIAAGLLLGLHLCSGRRVALLGSGAPGLMLAALALAPLSLPSIAEHMQFFSFRFPSLLQPALFAIAAGGIAAAAALSHWRTDSPLGVRLASRAVLGLASFTASLLALQFAVPSFTGEVATALGDWIGRRDDWLAGIQEFMPLFPSAALWEWSTWAQRAYPLHGVFALLAPLLVPVGLVQVVRARRAAGLAFATWTLALLILSLLQLRFCRLFTVNLAILSAFALAVPARQFAAFWPRLRPGLVLACSAGAILLFDPLGRAALAWAPAREPSPLEAAGIRLGQLAAPDTGILAPWDWGHALLALSGRGVVSAGFGPYVGPEGFREVEASFLGSEVELLALMERRHLGWLATGVSAQRNPETRTPLSASRVIEHDFLRRVPLAPTAFGGGGSAAHNVRHVEHLLPRFASRERDASVEFPVFRLWIYERVAGARVRGRVGPHQRVVARTSLWVHEQPLSWEAWSDADASGRFELILPLPNGLEGPELVTGAHYELSVDEKSVGISAVSESSVRRGDVLSVVPRRS